MPAFVVAVVVPVPVVVVVHDGDSGDIGILDIDIGNIRCCLPPCSGAGAEVGGVAVRKLRSASDENGGDAASNTVRIDAGLLLLLSDCACAVLFPQCDDCCSDGGGRI